jgi:hypothetical protein
MASVRCIFCGAISAWWVCGCEWSRRIADGELARPRTVIRGGVAVIEMCDELRRAARLAGVITGEYGGFGRGGSGAKHGENTLGDSLKVAETAEIGESDSLRDSLKRGIGVSESSAPVEADLANRRCNVCGKAFVPSRSRAKYCSDGCRSRAHRG